MAPKQIPTNGSSSLIPNRTITKSEENPNPRHPTSIIGHLTPEQQAVIITRRFEGAPATGTIPPGYKAPTYDPKYDDPEYSLDNLLAKYHRQAHESHIMEAEIAAENEARKISGGPPCQKIPEGYIPPTYDPKYDRPEYSFEALLAKLQRQTEEARVMEAEIGEEQRARLAKARKYQQERAAAQQQQQVFQQQQQRIFQQQQVNQHYQPVAMNAGTARQGNQQPPRTAAASSAQRPPLPDWQPKPRQPLLPTPPTDDPQNQSKPNNLS